MNNCVNELKEHESQLSETAESTHQYGVPMKESLLCKVLVFLAETPKSAAKEHEDNAI